MQAADIRPVPPDARTQSPFDLLVIFAGANIVATTLQAGASLWGALPPREALGAIAAGTVVGSLLVAGLAPLGPRLGVPSIIAARAALGLRGGGLVAAVLYLTNFAWMAVNLVIAASVAARIAGGPDAVTGWIIALGACSTAVVAGGPRAVKAADLVAVPLLLGVGAVITWAVWTAPATALPAAAADPLPWPRAFDVVIGYQVSWILMFADYSRYTRSERGAFGGVFLGLTLTSLWLMPLGLFAARAVSSADPGTVLAGLRVGWWGASLMVLATVTTNFVNIYLSGLAWRSLFPRTRDQAAVWSIGAVGTLLAAAGGAWLNRYVDFMLVLGGVLVPVGGVLLARFFLVRTPVRVDDLYDPRGPYARTGGFSVPGVVAWALGAAAYALSGASSGGTVPALVTATAAYVLLDRLLRKSIPD